MYVTLHTVNNGVSINFNQEYINTSLAKITILLYLYLMLYTHFQHRKVDVLALHIPLYWSSPWAWWLIVKTCRRVYANGWHVISLCAYISVYIYIYIYIYIWLHKRGLELMIGACVWYDLISKYIFHEAETSLRTQQALSYSRHFVPFTELASFITVSTTAHLSRYPTSLYPISYLTFHAFRLHFNSTHWFLHLTFPWIKLRMHFSSFTPIIPLPA